MKRPVLLLTILVAIALVPVAIRSGDVLVLSFAGLIPLYVDWRNGV